MKVAVSSTGTALSSTIDERFGRCRCFLLVETDDMHVEAIENPNADLSTGAGIQSAGLVANAGAKVVITGNCGPKALQVFEQTDIRIILGQHGVIRDVIENFRKGNLHPSNRGNLPQTSGSKPSAAMPSARGSGPKGGGRGMCMGGGRGMGGCGGGMGMGRRCAGTDGAALPGRRPPMRHGSRQETLEQLKQQMATIEMKIRDLT